MRLDKYYKMYLCVRGQVLKVKWTEHQTKMHERVQKRRRKYICRLHKFGTGRRADTGRYREAPPLKTVVAQVTRCNSPFEPRDILVRRKCRKQVLILARSQIQI